MMFALLAVVINWYPLPNVDSKAPRLTVKNYVLLSPCRLICFYTLYLKTWWSIPFSKPICWFQFQPWTHVDMSRPLASAKPRIWIIWPWQTCGRAITRRPIHGLEFTKVSFLIISTGIKGPVSGLGSSNKLLGMYKSRYDFFGTLIYLLRRSMISWWCMTSTCWPQHPRKLTSTEFGPVTSLLLTCRTFWRKPKGKTHRSLFFATFGVETDWASRIWRNFSADWNFLLPLPIFFWTKDGSILMSPGCFGWLSHSGSHRQLFSLRWDTTMMKPKKTFKGHKKVGPGFPFWCFFCKRPIIWTRDVKEIQKGLVSRTWTMCPSWENLYNQRKSSPRVRASLTLLVCQKSYCL